MYVRIYVRTNMQHQVKEGLVEGGENDIEDEPGPDQASDHTPFGTKRKRSKQIKIKGNRHEMKMRLK